MISKIILSSIYIIVFAVLLNACSDKGIDPPPLPYADPTDESPSWSPDGNWIAYHHFNPNVDDSNYNTGLYVIDTSGHNRRLLVLGPAYNPDWSPDSKKITFSSGDIFTINIDGDSLHQVTNLHKAYFPNWSPNGRKIAFDTPFQDNVGANVIWTINPDGTDLIDISEHDIGEMRDPDWAPDMGMIIYSGSHSVDSESQIWLINLNKNNRINLSLNEYTTNRYASWSPDGSNICWSATKNGNSDILIMDADGSNQRRVTSGVYPSWSPDSKKIVFQENILNEKKGVLWIINIDGTDLRQLTF